MFLYLQVKYLNVRFEREHSEQSAHLEDEQKRQISLIKQVKQLTIYLPILAMFFTLSYKTCSLRHTYVFVNSAVLGL